MTKREIFEIESSNADRIHLFLEGTFWIAYERSAFQFVRSIKPYQVKKKWIKNIGQDMVSLGFPSSALDAVVVGLERLEVSEKRIILKAPEALLPEEFDRWQSAVPITKSTQHTEKATGFEAFSIEERVRSFDIGNKTPLECLLFVSELKEYLARITPSRHAIHATPGL